MVVGLGLTFGEIYLHLSRERAFSFLFSSSYTGSWTPGLLIGKYHICSPLHTAREDVEELSSDSQFEPQSIITCLQDQSFGVTCAQTISLWACSQNLISSQTHVGGQGMKLHLP